MYMMKKILLLAGIVSLAACTNDPEETFSQGGGSSAGVKVIYDAEGAVEGQLIVKFRPSAADSLAAALASAEVAFRYEEQKAAAGRSTVFDFNDPKTRMEKAASEAVQAKYEFVFRAKILDYDRGEPLRL